MLTNNSYFTGNLYHLIIDSSKCAYNYEVGLLQATLNKSAGQVGQLCNIMLFNKSCSAGSNGPLACFKLSLKNQTTSVIFGTEYSPFILHLFTAWLLATSLRCSIMSARTKARTCRIAQRVTNQTD